MVHSSNSWRVSHQPRSRSGLMILFALALSLITGAKGQQTEAACTSLEWTFNSLGQSPCLVAAYLQLPCSTTGSADVPSISPNQFYLPNSNPNECDCSTVTYTLLSACAVCQGGIVGNWSIFSQNCTQKFGDGQYPLALPPGTAVPAWASQAVKGPDQFNLTMGQIVGDSPENFTSKTTSSASTPSGTGQPKNGTSSKSDAGLLAGSIVGGVCGMAIIGGLLGFYLNRRNKRRELRDEITYFPDGNSVSQIAAVKESGITGGHLSSLPLGQSQHHPGYLPMQSPGFYDPNDPSTFHAPPNRPITTTESDRIVV